MAESIPPLKSTATLPCVIFGPQIWSSAGSHCASDLVIAGMLFTCSFTLRSSWSIKPSMLSVRKSRMPSNGRLR